MSGYLDWRIADFPYQTVIQTRWGDNDMLGHLNNVVYNRMIETIVVRFTMGPVDVLDHASRAFTYGSKMGIDATRKWPEEGAHRAWPKMIAMDEQTKASVDAMWSTLGLPTPPRPGAA